jgi:hypothetical protein
MIIQIQNYKQELPVYIKFSQIQSSDSCAPLSIQNITATFNCTVVSHPEGLAAVMISYNQIDWYSFGGYLSNSTIDYYSTDPTKTFSFVSCSAGYTALDYTQTCQPCPVGTYKPSSGTYQCIQCANNTYADASGSSTCKQCPQYSTTLGLGANSSYQCVCDTGFYTSQDFITDYNNASSVYHNLNSSLYNRRCVSCPEGAVCPEANTTYPMAAFGYWNPPEIPQRFTFFSCFPSEACPGGGPANCSDGYTDVNCGLCATHSYDDSQRYYKWQNKCKQCAPGAWWRSILFILLLGLITLAFFGFSSIKVSHLSSISIAFSFWQIISMFK